MKKSTTFGVLTELYKFILDELALMAFYAISRHLIIHREKIKSPINDSLDSDGVQ